MSHGRSECPSWCTTPQPCLGEHQTNVDFGPLAATATPDVFDTIEGTLPSPTVDVGLRWDEMLGARPALRVSIEDERKTITEALMTVDEALMLYAAVGHMLGKLVQGGALPTFDDDTVDGALGDATAATRHIRLSRRDPASVPQPVAGPT